VSIETSADCVIKPAEGDPGGYTNRASERIAPIRAL